MLSDIARKESDLNNVSKNAQLYQQAVKVSFPVTYHHSKVLVAKEKIISKINDITDVSFKDYENETEKFRSILDLEDGLVPQTYKRSRLESPANIVKAEVRCTTEFVFKAENVNYITVTICFFVFFKLLCTTVSWFKWFRFDPMLHDYLIFFQGKILFNTNFLCV